MIQKQRVYKVGLVLLSIALLVSMVPFSVYAESASEQPTEHSVSIGDMQIVYTAVGDGTIQKVGQYTAPAGTSADIYLASLPYGATLSSVTGIQYLGMYGKNTTRILYQPGNSERPLLAEENYLTDTEFTTPPSDSAYSTLVTSFTYNTGFSLPNEDVKGYLCQIRIDATSGFKDWVFIQISTTGGGSGIDTHMLEDAIAIVWDADNNVPTDYSYQENDRRNGKTVLPKDKSNPTRGFWYEMTKEGGPLEKAQGTFSSQNAVDKALNNLQAAIAELIPSTRVNATLLYEALETHWIWDGDTVRESWGNANYEDISAANTTSVTWQPYAAAMAEAQELLDTLYDGNGEPTETNQSSLQPRIEALVSALDVGKLVNSKYYSNRYNYFQAHRGAAEALLEQADPSGMNEDDYTSDSWGELLRAWNTLNSDLTYRFEGGSSADMEMLLAFQGHYNALKTAYQGLVSDTDITVDFTYVNNFAAKYPALRQSGQDVFRFEGLQLSRGYTTVQDIIDASYFQVDSKEFGLSIPGDSNTSDTYPVYLVYINDSYIGSSFDTIQLHDGDRIRVIRVCEPIYVVEASSGLSSSYNQAIVTVDPIYIGDSLALIDMAVPDTLRVGDKASFSVTLTGAYGANIGTVLDPSNITLFVSAPYATETEWYINQPITNTGISTNASGNLEYTFTEPGWYTVSMFNVEDDTPTFTDIFDSTTYGVYPSVYAGDFAVIYVAPSDDETALIAKYKAEYTETATAYFDGFHDYDFADGYYEDTFQPQYETLLANLESALSYKALKEQFEADFALLKEYGATAIDHQGIVDALREILGQLPEDLTVLNSSHAAVLSEIQNTYSGMGEYTKTLLSQEELDRLDQLAAIDVDALPAAATVTVSITEIGTLPHKSGGGNPYYGYPELTWVITPEPDGTVGYPVWARLGYTNPLSAKAGDHVFIRRYQDCTEDLYRMVWSADAGTTWTSSVPQTLVTPDGVAYDGYYLVEYIVPQDVADGSTVTIQLKMWSKAEYDANGIEDTKAAALAALQSVYDSYDLMQYDDAGKAALAQALEDGQTAINAAATNDAIAAARKAAIAAMAAVPVAEGQQTNSSYDSGATVGRVYVTIENTTYPNVLYGTLAEGWYTLGEKDSMMTVILKVLEDKGYTWNGTGGHSGENDYSITYLASVQKDGQTLAEFTGGKKSGWMGTLNDWFVNESFSAFSVAYGKLENNDVIHVMYTTEKGADIGSVWGVNDTTLDKLTVSAGTLSPKFDGSTTDYTLIITPDVTSVKVTPIPVNKNYQSRIFLNNYNQDSAMFKRTDAIPVKVGDVIYVGVGEQGWPTMNSGGKPTKYTIRVATADDAVNALNPNKVNLSNYETYAAKLETIDRNLLSDSGKDKYDAVQERVDFFREIDEVKAKIAALPTDMSKATKAELQAAVDAYNGLDDAQKAYLTIAEKNKADRAAAALDGIILEETTAEKQARVDAVKAAIEALDFTVEQATANDAAALKTYAQGVIADVDFDGATAELTISNVTPAVVGSQTAPNGTNGSYTVTVTLTLDNVSATAKISNAVITATAAEIIEVDVNIISGDSATPIATVTSMVENGTATLHVVADKPCVVIVQKADGTYERLEAVKNGDGYDFVQDDYDDSMEFFVAVKGDYNGDGKFNTNDLAKANKDILDKKTIDPLQILIMGGNGKNLRPNALGKLNLCRLHPENMTW